MNKAFIDKIQLLTSTIFKVPDGLKKKRMQTKEFVYDRDLEYIYYNSVLCRIDQYDEKMNFNIAFEQLQLNLPTCDDNDSSDIVVVEL